jgi:hypothetical protein
LSVQLAMQLPLPFFDDRSREPKSLVRYRNGLLVCCNSITE